jgi:subtilisin-like proprotein convertase family protein
VSAPGQRISFRVGNSAVGNIARGEVTADALIPDNAPAGIRSEISIAERGAVKSIRARVSIIHPYIGDLQVELISPSGKRAMLHNRAGRDQDDLKRAWESASLPALAALAGEPIQGRWTLAIRDLERRDTGRLNWWGLEIEYSAQDQELQLAAQPFLAIPDADPQGVQSALAVAQAGAARDVKVSVEIAHSYRGDLLVDLVAPSGRSATLHDRAGGWRDDLRAVYDATSTPALAGLVGEAIQGNWTLRVRDLERQDTGKLEKWSLTLRY